MLPVERLGGKEEEHVMTISTKRSDCKYCTLVTYDYYIRQRKTLQKLPRLPLCKEHFAAYHFGGTNNNEDDEMDESEIICHTAL